MTDTKEVAVFLECSKAQALVLSDWIYRYEKEIDETEFDEEWPITAEEIVFLKLQAQLDTMFLDPSTDDYMEVLERARQRVIDDAHGIDPLT